MQAELKHHSGEKELHPIAGFWVSAVGMALWMSLLLWLLPELAQADTNPPGTTGSVEGEVLITRRLASQRMRFRLYPGFKPLPPPADTEISDDGRSNVVVYLQNAPSLSSNRDDREKLQITQMGETFIPHVLPIVKGSTVEFPNQDPIFHNVFSLSGTKTFDLGRYPKGDSRSVTFEQSGIVPVFCHLHSNMSAIILVLDNKFFAMPNSDGHYRIENIPEGTYTVVGWHERSRPVEQQVVVIAGQSIELNIVIPIEDDQPSGQ